jgi:formate hydrogenlyase transcriptional activator
VTPTDLPSFTSGEQNPFLHPDVLNEPEKLLASYFTSSTIGLSILNSELRYLAINDTLAAMNGLPPSEHMGKTVREVLGDFADIAEPKLRNTLSTGESVNFEYSAKLPGRNDVGHWILYYLPVRDASGTVVRVCVVVVEITPQKQLALSLKEVAGKLRKEMERLQALLDVSCIIAANWNLQETFLQVSASIRRVLYHEYAGFELHDPSTGLLVRQAEDFPMGKGSMSSLPISPNNSPGGLAFRKCTSLIFTKEELLGFDAEITKIFLSEGLQTLCCVPLSRPKGALGVLVLGSTRPEAFQRQDLTLLNQVAAQLAIALENQRAIAEIETLKKRLEEEKKYLEDEVYSEGRFTEFVGDSPVLQKVLEQVATVAPSLANVLVLGETGTGKELVARAVHRMSRRHAAPFIKLNCAAIPTGLLESELFGHEKGAFTGAVSQKLGRMELADGGTLFLDEVGEIPLELQSKLLRVLQDQEFERLGSNRTIKVDVRLVAATNRDLAQRIAMNEFRSDLFYRLSVFPIRVPPLRERKEDIPQLVRHYVRKFAKRMDRHIETIPKETIKILTNWSWPGNVRELENLMERSVILSTGSALHVPLSELQPEARSTVSEQTEEISDHTLDKAERQHIIRVLVETGGVLSGPKGAATRLGLKRTTLQSKMLRLKITKKDYLGS